MDEAYLWPNERQRRAHREASRSEIVEIYPNRASVPRDVWISLLLGAIRHIDILVFSGTFVAQTNPRIAQMLQERAQADVKIRLCFGDPHGQAVAIRGHEEGLADTLAAKIRASLTYYRGMVGAPGCEVRLHDTTLYWRASHIPDSGAVGRPTAGSRSGGYVLNRRPGCAIGMLSGDYRLARLTESSEAYR